MYELGFALPFIVIIGVIVWLVKEATLHNNFRNGVDKMIDENKKAREEYMDKPNKK